MARKAEQIELGSGVHCRLDELLEDRSMTLTRLGELAGVSIVNLSVLKMTVLRPSDSVHLWPSAKPWNAKSVSCWFWKNSGRHV